MTAFAVPTLPGTDIEFVGTQTVRPSPVISEIVAIPFTHDWGPLGTESGGLASYSSFGAWEGVYGDGDTDGRDAVLLCFAGPGIEGQAGASVVVSYRIATGDADRATINLTNGTEANALVLTGLYAGTRGNRVSVVVEADPANAANDRIRILLDGATVEKYSYAEADLAAAAASINLRSKYVTAVVNTDGTALTANAGTALTGGDDGEVITGAEWSDALDALAYESFSIFAPAALDDPAILASVNTWLEEQDTAGRPVVGVTGGPLDETLSAAIIRAAGYDNPHHVSLGGGNYTDDFLDKTLSTAQLAPRVAGVLAGRGQRSSLLFARLAGLHFEGASAIAADELEAAESGGVITFTRTESADADLMLAAGVTSYTGNTLGRPRSIFGDARLIRVIDLFIRRMRLWGNENIVGNTTVTEETRAAVRGQGLGEIASLIDQGLIINSSEPAEAPFFRADDPGDPQLEQAIPFEFGWRFAKTTRNLLGKGTVR